MRVLFFLLLSGCFRPTSASGEEEDVILLSVIISSIAAVLVALNRLDRRRVPTQPRRRRTFGACGYTWRQADGDEHDAWHRTNLRMSRRTFNRIVQTIQEEFVYTGARMPQDTGKLDFRANIGELQALRDKNISNVLV